MRSRVFGRRTLPFLEPRWVGRSVWIGWMLYKQFLDNIPLCDPILLVCHCKVTAVLLFTLVG